ncbi:MAG: SpoIIE family protein phosphatase, partial [Acidobacteriota bacterium]
EGVHVDVDVLAMELPEVEAFVLEPGSGVFEGDFRFSDEGDLGAGGLLPDEDAGPVAPSAVFEEIPPYRRGPAYEAWRAAASRDREAVRTEAARRIAEQRQALRRERSRMVFGDGLLELRRDGEVIGSLKPEVNAERLLGTVLRAGLGRQEGDMPFAIDRDGRLYAARAEDRSALEALDLASYGAGESWRSGDWVIAMAADESTGLRLGVARPLGDALRELRASAVRNLAVGLALIGVAILGLLPVSRRLSSGVRQVAEGADRIARGDLETRLPVRGSGELAHLARAFNSMVHDVRDHQERLLAGERHRRQEEMERQLIQAELDRHRRELDEARTFQLSMLPRELPSHDGWETAVHMETATEVGGDYYDFHVAGDAGMTAVVGDATGHGARAGTMVTVIKSFFTAHAPAGGTPSEFLAEASRTVRRMELGRMAMALTVLHLDGPSVRLSNAGMPPLLHFRSREGGAEEVLVPGMPLGGLAGPYRDVELSVESGDLLLAYSDGLPEQPAADGGPVGYDYVKQIFEAAAAAGSAAQVVEALAAEVSRLTGGVAPADDVTFLVLRRR